MSLTASDLNNAALYCLRHYVSVSYYAKSDEIFSARGGVAYPCVFSAFVMRVRDIWCLVTAGHVIDGIEEERKKGTKLDTFRIWDGWGVGAPNSGFVPFDFDEPPKIRINEDGLDYGVIPLRNYYVALLQAGGIVPVGEESFEKNWPADFQGYTMIGVPSSTVSLNRHDQNAAKFTQSTCIIHLEEEKSPPPELIKPTTRFYGLILMPEDAPEWREIGGDIEGMSGGPIVGVRRDDEGLKAWVFAIQSGWLRSKRIIAACYFQEFAHYVARKLDEAESET